MRVKYLDLATGKIASDCGVSQFNLTDNNYCCDCNRAIPFEGEPIGDSVCAEYRRYIVIAVERELMDEPFDAEDVIKRANSRYFLRLSSSEPMRFALPGMLSTKPLTDRQIAFLNQWTYLKPVIAKDLRQPSVTIDFEWNTTRLSSVTAEVCKEISAQMRALPNPTIVVEADTLVEGTEFHKALEGSLDEQ